jgi:predicted Zn-dependent protease
VPEARFLVLAAEAEAELARRLASARGSHLVVGVLLAEAGVLDEAERELRALAAANPGQADVQRLLAGLRTPRP